MGKNIIVYFTFFILMLWFPFNINAGQKTITNSIDMEFVLIPSGTFYMGADRNFENASRDEMPKHKIKIKDSFYIGKYEVTQKEWVAVMGENPSEFKGRNRPVERVSWDDVQLFIKKLNQTEKTNDYRLPTEAEWEYAARAQAETAYFFGDDIDKLKEYAWYDANSQNQTHSVGKLKPNN